LFVNPVTAGRADLQQPIINRKYLLNINALHLKLHLAGETRPVASGRRKFGRI
jgi:hypothetical protein